MSEFKELERVRVTEDTSLVAEGTVGTIVHVYKDKRHVELEISGLEGTFTVPMDKLGVE